MGKFRKLGVEDYILIAIGVVVMVIIIFAMSGCASKKAQKVDVLWHDGRCLLIAEGINAAEAKEITQMWQFKECEIKVSGSDKSNGIKPPMKPKE